MRHVLVLGLALGACKSDAGHADATGSGDPTSGGSVTSGLADETSRGDTSSSADEASGGTLDASSGGLSGDATTGSTCGGVDIPATRLTTTADPTPSSPRENITQWNWGRCLAADGGDGLHLVWTQLGSTSIEYPADRPDPIDTSSLSAGQILYRRSLDCGESWSEDVELTTADVGIDSAGVATAGDRVFAIWRAIEDGRWVVVFRASPDRGASWGDPVVISDNPIGISASPPSIAASTSGSVGMVWADGRARDVDSGTATTKEVSLATSDDGGATWNPVREVSVPDGYSSWTPALAMQGDAVHVAWTDERDDLGECTVDANPCREEEYYRRSDDGGVAWGPEVRLTADAPGAERESWAPSIAVAGTSVHVAFFDRRSDVFAVYYKRSSDGGDTWDDDVLLSVGLASIDTARPTIAAYGGAVEVAWFAYDGFPAVVYRNHSPDDGTTWSDPFALTSDDPTTAARIPHVAITPNGDAHAVWYDTRNSDAAGPKVEIYYARSAG